MGETEEFNTLAFEKRLMQLKDTQESIQGMSAWCLKQRSHHKKIVSSWLNVLKRVKIEQRLVLFYLANDVIQYSKRKNYEFVESWGLNLQKATPLVRDEKVRPKILRIFKIWEQRSVYDDEFLSDLTGLLSAGAIKKTDDDPMDFQPQQLVNKIKQCTVLEADTDLRLKCIHESHLELSDMDELCANLKERSTKDDVEKELSDGIACVERYTQALQREIVAREALLALLTSANQYYSTQRGEVKVVAYAYKNFGARVRALKRRLDELTPQLPRASPSPPARDEDVPSPAPDDDLPLPGDTADAYDIDKTFSTSFADGSLYNMGLASFLNSDNPLAMFTEPEAISVNNIANKIEVLNTRPSEKQDFDINDFLKNLAQPTTEKNTSDSVSVASGTISQQSQDALPGLDLLTPESAGNPPPPTSFYGSLDNSVNEEPEPYRPETSNNMWTSNNWNIPPAPVPPPAMFLEAPESPPHHPPSRTEPRVYNPLVRSSPPPVDVDHRGLLPPPPPPPVLPLLGNIEDVDHRSLPNLLTPPPRLNQPPLQPVSDVDHRNLISLTNQLPPVPPPPRPNIMNADQDYRVPPIVTPNDIVESVDMDLSEDEEQQGMYPPQSRQYNNNKVLVGGDAETSEKRNFKQISTIQDSYDRDVRDGPISAPIMPPINPFNDFDREKNEPLLSAPILQPPMSNPFDNMPPDLKNFNYQKNFREDPRRERDIDPYEEDVRSRNLDTSDDYRNRSPEFEDYNNSEWNSPRPNMNQRFPRNWTPRTNYGPQGFAPQFWPRNGPRPPNNRWMGPRPQRFW